MSEIKKYQHELKKYARGVERQKGKYNSAKLYANLPCPQHTMLVEETFAKFDYSPLLEEISQAELAELSDYWNQGEYGHNKKRRNLLR